MLTITLSLLAALFFGMLMAIETALSHANPHRVESTNAQEILNQTPKLLREVLVLRHLSLFLVTSLVTVSALGSSLSPSVTLLVALCASVALTFLLGVLMTRIMVAQAPESFLDRWGYFLRGLHFTMQPLDLSLHLLGKLGRDMLSNPEGLGETRQEVIEYVESEEAGEEIDEVGRQMIRHIMELDDTRVAQIMTPLNRVVAIPESDVTEQRLRSVARISGFSRIPVFRGYILQIVGHVDLYDLIKVDENRIRIHTPNYVPESKYVDDLLQEFLRERRRLDVVIDEHGACSGIVTREDILEEIFGEIADEFDRENPPWMEEPGGTVLIDASVDLYDLNAHFGLAIQTEQSDTLAGFIYERLGRVPRRGEAIQHQGLTLRVVEMKPPQIVKVRLEKTTDHAQ